MSSQVCSRSRKLPILTSLIVLLTFSAAASCRAQDDDPPMQAGRISYASGTVSIQPAGLDDWGQAQLNLPLGPGDRIFTDADGRAEIQIGDSYLRIAPNSDVSVVEDTPYSISIGIGQGSVEVRCHGLWPNQQLHINTPNGAITFGQPGSARVDVMPDQSASIFTGIENYQTITGADGFNVGFSAGQSIQLAGSNPVASQWLQPNPPDDLDAFSQQRDQQIFAAASWRYISSDIPGGDQLDAYGNWMPGTPYGAVWFPRVDAGWSPYHYGHWVNHAPWGPVWVEDEPWGYAPFHFGRWVNLEGRWGWVPGPRAVHPVWSPALVVFAGGVQVGGVAVSAWFPLGPGEPYRPWYPCSPRYVDQVNITNMAEGPRVHVLSTYVGFNFGGLAFAYRQTGFTAMRYNDFAAGRPVRETNVVVNVNVIQHVTIVERPVVQINERVIVQRAPSRPVPVAVARPTVINDRGMVVSARAGFRPVAPPVRPVQPVRVLPGRRIAPPPNNNNFGHQPPPNGGQPGGGQFNGGQQGNNRPGYQPGNQSEQGQPGGNHSRPNQPVTQAPVNQQPPVDQPRQPGNNIHQTIVPPGGEQRQFQPAQPQQPQQPPSNPEPPQNNHQPPQQQQPQPDSGGPTGQRMHKPAAQPEDQPQQNHQPPQQQQPQPQPDSGLPTGQRMHKPTVQPDQPAQQQPTNNPPAHNNNPAPNNGAQPQSGSHQGDNHGNNNQHDHGGKPDDHDRKDNHKDDKDK